MTYLATIGWSTIRSREGECSVIPLAVRDVWHRRWGMIFAAASVAAKLLLGRPAEIQTDR
jgi:hypothetical protein